MTNPHAPHPSGLPVGRDEKGWAVRLIWSGGDVFLRGEPSEDAVIQKAREVLAQACEAVGLSSEGTAGDLLARLRG
jgi:hypothetical protein